MSFTKDNNTDNYTTDKEVWKKLEKFIPLDKKIYCPFYCDGKQKEYFKELFNIDIIHEDVDFFNNNFEYDLIIDNIPFSKKKEILTKLREIDKPFILIIPTCLLCLKWFQKLYSNQIQVIIPNKRLTFKHLTNPKKGYTPPFGSFIYCYKMNLEKDLIFI